MLDLSPSSISSTLDTLTAPYPSHVGLDCESRDQVCLSPQSLLVDEGVQAHQVLEALCGLEFSLALLSLHGLTTHC